MNCRAPAARLLHRLGNTSSLPADLHNRVILLVVRLLTIISFLALTSLCAAQVRERPNDVGPWRSWSFTAIESTRKARGVTPVELQAFQARYQELAAILRRAPAVSTPVGFAAELWGNLNGYTRRAGMPPGNKIPLAGSVTFGAFPLIEFMRNGKLMNEDLRGGETNLMQFTVNEIDDMYGDTIPAELGGEDRFAFVEPQQGESVAGLMRLGKVFVLASSKNQNRPLWVPVTHSEMLAPILAGRRQEFELQRQVWEKEKREFAEWQTPAKRAARRADWQQAAAALGPEGRNFVSQMEKTDVEIEKFQRERLAPGGPSDKSLREAERKVREVEALMSPQAANLPACYEDRAERIAERYRVLAAGTPASCRPLVKTNWAFFDSTRPRSAPQVLMIQALDECLKKDWLKVTRPGGCTTNRELIKTVDWDAVRAWLDK